jgi:hypothetical protein
MIPANSVTAELLRGGAASGVADDETFAAAVSDRYAALEDEFAKHQIADVLREVERALGEIHECREKEAAGDWKRASATVLVLGVALANLPFACCKVASMQLSFMQKDLMPGAIDDKEARIVEKLLGRLAKDLADEVAWRSRS